MRIISKLKGIHAPFSPIYYVDDEKTSRSILLDKMANINIIIITAWALIFNLLEPNLISIYGLIILTNVSLLVKRLNHIGRLTLAANIILYGYIITFGVFLYFTGGHFTDFYLAFIIIPLISRMIGTNRTVVVTTIISILIGLFILILEINGQIPPLTTEHTSFSQFMSKSTFIILIAFYMKLIYETREKAKIISNSILADKLVQDYSEENDQERREQLSSVVLGISHDFANFLTVIQNYHALLEDISKEDSQEDLNEIAKITQRALDLNKLLMTYARGNVDEELEVVDLNETINENLLIYQKLAGVNNSVKFQQGENLRKINIRPIHFDQILSNLLVNARDATDGEGTIWIRTYAADFTSTPYVCLQVEDTGRGIPNSVKEHIFKPFFSTKGDKGRGVGLSTVKQILENYNGSISFTSKVGRGSTFLLLFPVMADRKIVEENREISSEI